MQGEEQKIVPGFTSDPLARWSWWLALGLNAAVWALLRAFIPFVKTPVNLHYTIYFGIDRVGSWWMIWLLPIIGLSMLCANFAYAGWLYRTQQTASKVIVLVTVLLQAVLLVGAYVTVVRGN